jgi:hypothetical protein
MQTFRPLPPLQAMPAKVFISYSHQDKDFADRLARDLMARRILVWWDDWMIQVGDSLLAKIEEGISTSSYLGIVLTPSSVASSWVREELNAALLRQLDEKRVFVLPILAMDCEIPLLLRDKKYADFRSDYEEGLARLLKKLKPIPIRASARQEQAQYHHDWALEWGKLDGVHGFRLQVTTHSEKTPYAVTCTIMVVSNPQYSERLEALQQAGFEYGPRLVLLMWALKLADQMDAVILIEGDEVARAHLTSRDPKRDVGLEFHVSARRLGTDPGDDVLYEWKSVLRAAAQSHLDGIFEAHSPEELARLDEWLDVHSMDRP